MRRVGEVSVGRSGCALGTSVNRTTSLLSRGGVTAASMPMCMMTNRVRAGSDACVMGATGCVAARVSSMLVASLTKRATWGRDRARNSSCRWLTKTARSRGDMGETTTTPRYSPRVWCVGGVGRSVVDATGGTLGRPTEAGVVICSFVFFVSVYDFSGP